MIDIPTETITVERNAAGSWVNGKFVEGAQETLSFEASVQPARGNDIKMLPEARRTAEAVKIYTDTKLRTSDELNQLPADIVIRDGKRFEVHTVMNWSIGTDIPHYKVIAVKEDGQGGGSAA